jgi:hypothetical protein
VRRLKVKRSFDFVISFEFKNRNNNGSFSMHFKMTFFKFVEAIFESVLFEIFPRSYNRA